MIIRKMEDEDLDQVVIIENTTTNQPWSKADFASSKEKETNLYLVAVETDTILGYCGMWGVAGEGQIYNVAVKEGCRKRGIAFKMLSHLLKMGNDMGLQDFTLEVRAGNVAALHVYHKLGFHSVGTHKNFYSFPREDAEIMWFKKNH